MAVQATETLRIFCSCGIDTFLGSKGSQALHFPECGNLTQRSSLVSATAAAPVRRIGAGHVVPVHPPVVTGITAITAQ